MKKIVTIALFLGGATSAMPIKDGDPFFGLSSSESDEDTSKSYATAHTDSHQTVADAPLPTSFMACGHTEKQTHEIITTPLSTASASSASIETVSNASLACVVERSHSPITLSSPVRASVLGKRKSPEPEVALLRAQAPAQLSVHEDLVIQHFNQVLAQEIALPALRNPAYFVKACTILVAMAKQRLLRHFHLPLGLTVRMLDDPKLGAQAIVALNEIFQTFPAQTQSTILQMFNRL